MRNLALALPALLLAVTLGCGDRKNPETGGVSDTSISVATPPVADAPTEARDFSYEERQEFAESIRSQLAGIDGEIAQLATEVKSKGGAVSDRALARIRAAREAVTKDLSRIDAATEADWQQIKDRVNRSVENLDEAIQGAQPK